MSQANTVGSVGWMDLTVPDADRVRDFYREVVGWTASDVSMGAYSDYCMHPPGGDPVAGVCHARGVNAGIPPVWMIYITVADLDASVANCQKLGGTVVGSIRDMGSYGRMAIIRDPAGAVCGLIQPKS